MTVFGIPLYVLVLVVSGLAGLAAPVLVACYHRLLRWVYAKTGVMLPDNPVIDSEIAAVLKALLPELLREAVARKIDPAALLAAIEAVVGKSGATSSAAASYDPTKSTPASS